MKCNKCGNDIEINYYGASPKEYIKCFKNREEPVPLILANVYKNHHRFYGCEKCGEPIDYKDMPMNMFFSWLQYSSESGDSREDSGKALIRYFNLGKLLKE